MWLVITILIGVTGGLIAIKLKVPAGAIIGSMLAVVIFNVFTGRAVFPQEFRILVQIGTGAYIGSRIYKKDVMELKHIIRPTIILTVSMCLYNIAVSLFLNSRTDIDLVTTLFATAPAGVTDMTLISVDFGADPSKVAAIQMIRLVSIIAIMPTLIKYFISRTNKEEIITHPSEEINAYIDKNKNTKVAFQRTIYTLIIGVVCGYIGYLLGIAAGAISFAMIGCSFYNIKTSKAYLPIHLRRGIQILGGILIGAKITMEQIVEMRVLLPAIAVTVLGYILLNFVLAFLITKYSTLDIKTALYGSAAGGLTDMAIIASEMGADAPKVAALQFARVVSVIVFYPIIIEALLSLIN